MEAAKYDWVIRYRYRKQTLGQDLFTL